MCSNFSRAFSYFDRCVDPIAHLLTKNGEYPDEADLKIKTVEGKSPDGKTISVLKTCSGDATIQEFILTMAYLCDEALLLHRMGAMIQGKEPKYTAFVWELPEESVNTLRSKIDPNSPLKPMEIPAGKLKSVALKIFNPEKVYAVINVQYETKHLENILTLWTTQEKITIREVETTMNSLAATIEYDPLSP